MKICRQNVCGGARVVDFVKFFSKGGIWCFMFKSSLSLVYQKSARGRFMK